MIPMKGMQMSDGGFSAGLAQAALENESITDPVIGVVNGQVAPIETLEKDLTTATFEVVDSKDSLLGYESYTLIPGGGTIDFEFDGLDGVHPAQESLVPGYLRNNIRTFVDFDAMPPILKDSRLLTQEDIDMIVAYAQEAPTEHILVTAGLLRMAELRDNIKKGLAGKEHRDKRVVITGARYMLGSLGRTDAPYNLGYAHGKLGTITPGTHVAITGRLLEAGQDPLEYCYTDEELATVTHQAGPSKTSRRHQSGLHE
jgi:hypothetical protein